LSEALFELKVGDQSARGRLILKGELLQSGVIKVPLCWDTTILSAESGGTPLPLTLEGASHVALLTGPGPFEIFLETIIPVSIEAGQASLRLVVPWAGSTRLSLDLPGDHTNVQLNPGLITSKKGLEARTSVEASLVPGSQTKIQWTTREMPVPPVARETRYISDVKTLVTVGEADLRLTALVDTTVVQGDPSEFELPVPPGYEVTETAGNSLASTDVRSGLVVLKTNEPTRRSHQFLVSMERSLQGVQAEAPLLGLKGPQRETGEILVEAAGTMELTAAESGQLRRMDVREVNPALRSLAKGSLQAAFRFHRNGAQPAGPVAGPDGQNRLMLSWTRFPETQALPAAAERAEVTTLVTSEGKTLTEVALVVRNEAQPFLKVGLPQGASLLTAEVSGEKVKPVEGTDGIRVPLLRAGFRPEGPYIVSFVYFNPGAAFGKSGNSELVLPRLDLPMNVLLWEVFLPDRFSVKDFAGNAVPQALYASGDWPLQPLLALYGGVVNVQHGASSAGSRGIIQGVVTDQTGAVLPGAEVIVTEETNGSRQKAVTNDQGRWAVVGLASGPVSVSVTMPGFNTSRRTFQYDSGKPAQIDVGLDVGSVSQTIEVSAQGSPSSIRIDGGKAGAQPQTAPSANVSNLQRRVAGVLPIGVEVPRAGKAYRFVRPLVLDEETRVSFKYKVR